MNTVTRAIGRIAGSSVNIRARFVLGFAAICAILAGAVVAVLWRMGDVEARIDRIAYLRVPTSISSARLANDINTSLAALRGWMLTGESSFKAERIAIWRDIDAVSADMDRLSAMWTDPDNVARWTTFKATLDAFREAQRRIEDLAHGAGERPAATLPYTEAAPKAARLLEALIGPRQVDGSHAGGMLANQGLLLAEEAHAAEADIALLKTIVLALFSAGPASAESTESSSQPSDPLTIVTVTNDEVDLGDLPATLEANGHSVIAMDSGRRFLDTVGELLSPDLVLMSYNSIDLQAPLVVKTVRAKQETDFPIILLVPSSMELPSIAEQVPYFDDHITVPFDRETLMEKIAGLSIRPPQSEDLLASA